MKPVQIRRLPVALASLLMSLAIPLTVDSNQPERYWIQVKAKDTIERSAVANTGFAIEGTREDFVYGTGTAEELAVLQKMNRVENFYPLTESMMALDFPNEDSAYHNYNEVVDAMNLLVRENSDVAELFTLGSTVQGTTILGVRISTNLPTANTKPGIFFVGGHHAREHLSVEMPLRFMQNFLKDYRAGNPRIVRMVEGREIHIVPALNPDGLDYDIEGGRYKSWRKNRRQNSNNTFGVDLNRNYGFKWGTGGSSSNPSSDTFKGPTPFSEPETTGIKNYLEARKNISIVLSFHTFSELILFPWGHKNASIENDQDRRVHEVMAQTMSGWNRYTPQRSSDLYIASGDLTDWSYGALKMISFTFELDPADMWSGGGFYPGAGVIPGVVQKNTEPCLYLIEHADNPYRVLSKNPYRPI